MDYVTSAQGRTQHLTPLLAERSPIGSSRRCRTDPTGPIRLRSRRRHRGVPPSQPPALRRRHTPPGPGKPDRGRHGRR
jgi:hypothetical protein